MRTFREDRSIIVDIGLDGAAKPKPTEGSAKQPVVAEGSPAIAPPQTAPAKDATPPTEPKPPASAAARRPRRSLCRLRKLRKSSQSLPRIRRRPRRRKPRHRPPEPMRHLMPPLRPLHRHRLPASLQRLHLCPPGLRMLPRRHLRLRRLWKWPGRLSALQLQMPNARPLIRMPLLWPACSSPARPCASNFRSRWRRPQRFFSVQMRCGWCSTRQRKSI